MANKLLRHPTFTEDDFVVYEKLEDLSDEIRRQASKLGKHEIRFLVDTYYQMQDRRKATSNQERSLIAGGEPILLTDWIVSLDEYGEKKIRSMLQAYAEGEKSAQWAMSIRGIGPVIAAGLSAHIDITQAPTVGHIWRFAGLDPTQRWLGSAAVTKIVKEHLNGRKPTEEDVTALSEIVGGLRPGTVLRMATTDKKDGSTKPLTEKTLASALAMKPWNGNLKTLCWKIGESFIKVKNNKDDVYGKMYDQRKELEVQRNDAGQFADQAANKLATTNIGKTTDAYKWYSAGMLPPAQIHQRSARYATKIFLAHYHHVAYELEYGQAPPKPYVIEHLGHAHYLAPPNWPM